MNEELLWEATDIDGRRVKLSVANFQSHLSRHPEIADYVEEAKQTVEDPDFIVRLDNGAFCYYKAGLGRGQFTRCYVLVIIRYHRGSEMEEGSVATYYLTTKAMEGRVVWRRE